MPTNCNIQIMKSLQLLGKWLKRMQRNGWIYIYSSSQKQKRFLKLALKSPTTIFIVILLHPHQLSSSTTFFSIMVMAVVTLLMGLYSNVNTGNNLEFCFVINFISWKLIFRWTFYSWRLFGFQNPENWRRKSRSSLKAAVSPCELHAVLLAGVQTLQLINLTQGPRPKPDATPGSRFQGRCVQQAQRGR